MRVTSQIFWAGALLICMAACRTSQDLSRTRAENYDPAEVTTIENPVLTRPAPVAVSSAAAAPQTAAPTPAPEILSTESLQREVAIQQGELEDLRNSIQKERETLNARIAQLEQENLLLKAEVEKNKATEAPAAAEAEPLVDKKMTADKLWELARRELRSGEMNGALPYLETFIKKFPQHPRALPALLLYGMAQYRLEKFRDAAFTFNQALDKYPKKPDIALAWLGQGASFLHMNQREDSKLFFEEVIKLYPKSPEAREARVLLKKKSKAPADLFAVFSVWTSKILR